METREFSSQHYYLLLFMITGIVQAAGKSKEHN